MHFGAWAQPADFQVRKVLVPPAYLAGYRYWVRWGKARRSLTQASECHATVAWLGEHFTVGDVSSEVAIPLIVECVITHPASDLQSHASTRPYFLATRGFYSVSRVRTASSNRKLTGMRLQVHIPQIL